jgi:hypothetical protein
MFTASASGCTGHYSDWEWTRPNTAAVLHVISGSRILVGALNIVILAICGYQVRVVSAIISR